MDLFSICFIEAATVSLLFSFSHLCYCPSLFNLHLSRCTVRPTLREPTILLGKISYIRFFWGQREQSKKKKRMRWRDRERKFTQIELRYSPQPSFAHTVTLLGTDYTPPNHSSLGDRVDTSHSTRGQDTAQARDGKKMRVKLCRCFMTRSLFVWGECSKQEAVWCQDTKGLKVCHDCRWLMTRQQLWPSMKYHTQSQISSLVKGESLNQAGLDVMITDCENTSLLQMTND